MNIYYIGIFIGLLLGIGIAAFYCLVLEFWKSEEERINDFRRLGEMK